MKPVPDHYRTMEHLSFVVGVNITHHSVHYMYYNIVCHTFYLLYYCIVLYSIVLYNTLQYNALNLLLMLVQTLSEI